MKIAFVSDNGTTISRHFGRAHQYVVVTLEAGQEVARELRVKDACGHGHHGHGHGHGHGHDHEHKDHGHDEHAPQANHAEEHEQHNDQLAAITDCDLVVAGGMGTGMDQRLRAAGLRTVRTRMKGIDQALQAYLAGELSDMIELVH